MRYVVSKYIKCSATVMLLWWSCNAYILHSLSDIYAKNGIANIELYNMVMCGGDGPVMTKNAKLLLVLTRNIILTVHRHCPCAK